MLRLDNAWEIGQNNGNSWTDVIDFVQIKILSVVKRAEVDQFCYSNLISFDLMNFTWCSNNPSGQYWFLSMACLIHIHATCTPKMIYTVVLNIHCLTAKHWPTRFTAIIKKTYWHKIQTWVRQKCNLEFSFQIWKINKYIFGKLILTIFKSDEESV